MLYQPHVQDSNQYGNLTNIKFDVSVNCFNLANGSYVDTNTFIVPKSGHYICIISAAPCGANNSTNDGIYFEAELRINDALAYMSDRNKIAVSIAKAWDYSNMSIGEIYLTQGQKVLVRFTNRMGISTVSEYHSTFSARFFRIFP